MVDDLLDLSLRADRVRVHLFPHDLNLVDGARLALRDGGVELRVDALQRLVEPDESLLRLGGEALEARGLRCGLSILLGGLLARGDRLGILALGKVHDARVEVPELDLLLIQQLHQLVDAAVIDLQLLRVRRDACHMGCKEGFGLFNLRAPILENSSDLRLRDGHGGADPVLDLGNVRLGEGRHRGECELTLVSLNGVCLGYGGPLATARWIFAGL